MPESAGPSSNFLHKPIRGWLHPDEVIMKEGVVYSVRYIGCLDVNTSMKSLDFDSRFQIAKECINRVCETAGLKTADKKRKVDKKLSKLVGDTPNMRHAGSDVKLLVSSTCLTLKLLDSNVVIATHDMPRISFASGGDAETLDFVAYVAKDVINWRACFVLECGGGLAQDVITTIGQAFDLRFKQFLTRPLIEPSRDEREREYYNDMPGKVPPDVGPPPVPPLPTTHSNIPESRERSLSTNLIDLNCEVVAPPLPLQTQLHEYVNDIIPSNKTTMQAGDIFDMQPFTNSEAAPNATSSNHGVSNEWRLQEEVWFHGCIGRQQAEAMLHNDGDFLVRESQGSPGQYVLTGIQSGVKKHLLLIDPEGVVRTKDRMFHSVSHLINFHCQNKLPIISAESALILLNPVKRQSLPR